MKVLILAGGYGSRLSEETETKPKPMVEIGSKPILWHIMKIYSQYGFNEFVILLGYKGYVIKEYFFNYFLHQSNVTIDLSTNQHTIHNTHSEPWKVTLLETGLNTMTGGRIKRASEVIGNDDFMLTYGDGVADVNINDLLKFHQSHKGLMTLTAVKPEGRFGSLDIRENNKVSSFREKPRGDGGWINGGFFVCKPEILNHIKDDSTVFEHKPLESLAKEGNLYTFKHNGFWCPMDTLRDKNLLETLISNNKAPWITW